jgi:hypothetical protein
MKKNNENLIDQFRIRTTISYPEPNYMMGISIGPNTIRFGGEGDISVVTGKAKSTKTFFMGIMTASALTDNCNSNVVSNEGKKVLYFDTEQSHYNASKSLWRILAVAGDNFSDDIHYYALRGLNVNERIKFIEHVIEVTPEVKAVFIDGARDLVTSVNDEYQATHITNLFSNWTQKGSFHLTTVLHENSNSEKMRGHLGTELTNKAENVFVVELDKNESSTTSNVKTRYSRNGNNLEFSFIIDDNGIPQIDLKSKKHLDYDAQEVISCMKDIFDENTKIRHTELIDKFQLKLNRNGIDKGKNILKKWLEKYLELGIVKKEGAYRSPNAFYYFNA